MTELNQKVWTRDDPRKYVVLSHVEPAAPDDDVKGRWELELTEYFEVEFAHGIQEDYDTIIEYHRTWIGARFRVWEFMQDEHLTISRRTLRVALFLIGFIAVFLAFLGISSAYQQVGFNSPAGRIITIAIVIEASLTAAVLAYNHRHHNKEET